MLLLSVSLLMLITVLCCGIDSPGWTGSQDITDLVFGPADGTFLVGWRKRDLGDGLLAQVEARSILCVLAG